MTTQLKKTTYVPAVGGINNTKDALNDVKRYWWHKERSAFYYPMFLISFTYKAGGIYDKLRERLQVDKDVWILGDSGGFSRISVGDTVDAIKVLRWAEYNDMNAQISLDFPPYKMGAGQQFGAPLTKGEYLRRMQTSNDDANKMMELKESKKLEIYGVIQGESYPQMKQWHEDLIRDHEFSAHALSPKPSDSPEKIAMYAAYAIQNLSDKNLHYLQVSGKNTLPIVIYSQKYLKGRVTSDTATYAQGRMNRTILCSHNFPKWYNIKAEKYMDDHYDTPFLPCNCPACAEVDTFKDIGDTAIGQWLSLHNLFHLIQFSAFIEGYIKYDEEEFKKYIKKECRPETLSAFKVIDDAYDGKDIEKSMQRHFHKHKNIGGFI